MREQPDLDQLALRDLAQCDDLLALVREQEIGRSSTAFAAWLPGQPEAVAAEIPVDAFARFARAALLLHLWLPAGANRRSPQDT